MCTCVCTSQKSTLSVIWRFLLYFVRQDLYQYMRLHLCRLNMAGKQAPGSLCVPP